MIAVPYPVETNDIVVYAVERHPAEELFTRCTAAIDTLHAESAAEPRVLAIALHPYLSGTPHRIGVLDRILRYALGREGVCVMTASELLDWYVAQVPAPPRPDGVSLPR